MFAQKEGFLQLLVDAGDCINPEKDAKPLRLKTACANVLLHSSIDAGNIKDVTSLLELGISVNCKLSEKDRKSALCRAVQQGFADIVEILLNYGANIHEKTENGMSLLHYAVSKGDYKTVDVLASSYDVDVDEKDHEGITALYRAAEKNDIDTACVLDYCGAYICMESGVSLVHYAVSRNCFNAIKCFAMLDVDLDMLDSSGETPLYQAAKAGNLKMAKELIENGSDLYVRDSDGNTLLHIAAKEGNLTAIGTLLDIGMDVNVEGGWWNLTPLHVAADTGNLKAAELLIQRKACVGRSTIDGRTALILAKYHANISMINLLSSHM